MSIKIDAADIAFSQYIRLRDRCCMRCYSPVKLNEKGMPVSHHASHFWGRGRENTRFDPENVVTHCHGCHAYLTANPEEHRAWKLKQIGQERYDALMLRANTYKKKDRRLELMIWREAIKSLTKA